MGCISGSAIGGAISGIGSLGSGIFGASAATKAADTQAKAAMAAANATKDIYNSIRSDLAPYRSTGQDLNQYLYTLLMGGNAQPLTKPIDLNAPTVPGPPPAMGQTFAPSMGQLRGTPGYQFSLQQGMKGAQNALAAQGLGAGGPSAIGASKYAEGLAETTYQDQFSNWYNTQSLDLSKYSAGLNRYSSQLAAWLDTQNLDLSQKQLVYNMLSGGAQLGEAAAAGTASAGTQLAGTYGSYLTSAGAAQAAGTIGSANALTSGISGAGSSALSTGLINALTGGSSSSLGSGSIPGMNNSIVTGDYSTNLGDWSALPAGTA